MSKRTYREETHLKEFLTKLEPSGKGDPKKINKYLEMIKEVSVFDRRVVCFEVAGKLEKEKLILTGLVNFPSQKEGLIKILQELGFNNMEDRIEVLPSKKLGKKIFAIAAQPAVPFYKSPNKRSELVTEAIFGESLFLLDVDTAVRFYFAQTAVGYLGWVEKEMVIPMDWTQFRQARSSGLRALFQKNFYRRFSLLIPTGADLKLTDKGLIQLPDGREVPVPESYYTRYQAQPKISAGTVSNRIVEIAKQFLSVRYLWGGNTGKGLDCSGFVQSVYRAYGINLPRDASEQFIVGEIVGLPGYTEELQPGDLLFFAGFLGRISHVAIYIGNGEYIHATEPKVTINSLNSAHKNYSAKYATKFVLAKRILRYPGR